MGWLPLSLLALILSSLGVRLLLRHLSQSFLDVPNERSSHSRPTPRGGGLAFVPAFFIAAIIAASMGLSSISIGPEHPPWWEVLLLMPLFLVGAVDDRRGLSAGSRYFVQLAVAGVAVSLFGPFAPLQGSGFGMLPPLAPWLQVTITVIVMTALINFYNFMDGLDGLVAGTAFIQFVLFGSLLRQPIWWLLAGAVAGFLVWNWAPAKMFMGDAGSTVVGGAVGLALVEAPFECASCANGRTAVAILCALAVTSPIVVDATYTLCRRLLRRENILKPHKSHLYQRLNQAGWSHGSVATSYVLLTLIIGLLVLGFGATGAIAGTLLTFALIPVVEIYVHAASAGRLSV